MNPLLCILYDEMQKGIGTPSTTMDSYPTSSEILRRNRQVIPGGVVSTNRAVQPEIVFVKGKGAYIWSAEGKRLFSDTAAPRELALVATKTTPTGVLLNTYRHVGPLKAPTT